jgi:protein-tyrosine phosphatase
VPNESPRTVLFLCTGNYYRSRFAEIVFNSVAAKMRLPWRAASRGLALERGAGNVGPIAGAAVAALDALAIRAADEVGRFPMAAVADDFQAANWIVALKEAEHRPLLAERFPDWTERVEFWHVDDAPHALAEIEREVMDLAARLITGGRRRERVPEQSPPAEEPAVAASPPRKPLTARVGRETAGRKGKGVTTVFDLPLDDDQLRELAGVLKQRCGTGGTVKNGRIEIQGDQRERIAGELVRLGYKVKRA